MIFHLFIRCITVETGRVTAFEAGSVIGESGSKCRSHRINPEIGINRPSSRSIANRRDQAIAFVEKSESVYPKLKDAGGFELLRANVWKYRAAGGHGQTLVFAKIWFVDGYYSVNECDVVCFSKYRLNFEKKGRKSISVVGGFNCSRNLYRM